MEQFQKLTRNLYLTFHGQIVHRKQRQMSEFLMCYQQFASHAYCGAAGPVSKMASQQAQAFCGLRFEVSRFVITVQREFCARFRTAGNACVGVGGQHHAPAALPPGKTRYPLYRRLGGPQGRSWLVRKISPSPGFDPRTVQPVASRYTD
jgi:hypothetical protein